GGGNHNEATSDIALRWMLGEANGKGLRLNAAAEHFMLEPPDRERPIKKESRSVGWALIERFERQAIDNTGRWPVLRPAWGPRPREVENVRDHVIWVHESATGRHWPNMPLGCRLETAHTSRLVRR